jgi:hypothetical protein
MRGTEPRPELAMTGEDEGDAHTLGLLVELRALCQKIADHNDGYGHEVHRLLQQLYNPNLHVLDRDLSYRVLQLGSGYYGETLRTVSANSNLTLGHAALDAAVKQNPKSSWLLKYPGGVAGRYDPPGMNVDDKS